MASQPPLYAWLEAVGLALSADRNPLATVLPSYVGGAVVVVLVYLHGRLWRGPGLGLVAAVLTGFNRNLLLQMQQATPTTLAPGRDARGAALLRLAPADDLGVVRRRPLGLGRAGLLGGAGGLSLGVSLMAVGLFGAGGGPGGAATPGVPRRGRAAGRARDRAAGGGWLEQPEPARRGVALAVALAVAAPWHLWMIRAARAGGDRRAGSRRSTWRRARASGLLARMIRLAPATLALGLFAAVRAIRQALTDETDDRAIVGGVLWVALAGRRRAACRRSGRRVRGTSAGSSCSSR